MLDSARGSGPGRCSRESGVTVSRMSRSAAMVILASSSAESEAGAMRERRSSAWLALAAEISSK